MNDFYINNSYIKYKIIIIIGYIIPLIGWIIPLYLFNKNKYCHFHGKQGFLINRSFIVVIMLYMALIQFIPANHSSIENYLFITIIMAYFMCIFIIIYPILINKPLLNVLNKINKNFERITEKINL